MIFCSTTLLASSMKPTISRPRTFKVTAFIICPFSLLIIAGPSVILISANAESGITRSPPPRWATPALWMSPPGRTLFKGSLSRFIFAERVPATSNLRTAFSSSRSMREYRTLTGYLSRFSTVEVTTRPPIAISISSCASSTLTPKRAAFSRSISISK